MEGILPEEPGQPTIPLMDLDVEPTSENVRTSDAPVSSHLRSAQCGSIVFGTNPLDQMTMQAADRGTCQSNSSPLASSMHFHEAPASTAVRNASTNLLHVHHPEARYPDMINVNGGGTFIQVPSGPRMLHRAVDLQTTNYDDETEVLTQVLNPSLTNTNHNLYLGADPG